MMGLWDLGGMAQALPEIFGAKVALVPLDPGPYGAMAYPRWLPLLKFRVQWYGAAGYGNVSGCRKSGLRHFFEVFIAPLRLRRGQGAMQGNPCYARLFADLTRMSPNPIKASGGCGPRTPGGFSTGCVFAMHTRALGGRMELATLVFTPNVGGDVPLLLVDVMSMGKKRAAFVEYYDCTKDGAPGGALAATGAKFADLPDYPEKPAWYVARRTPYSLIKGGVGADGWRLWAMLAAAVECGGSLWGELPQAHRGPGSKPGRACGVYRADDPAGEPCFRHIGAGAGKGGGGAVFPHPGHAGNL